ncbi:hypothetical protein [Flavivirga eckloniae]|uniref:Uncharacterized protein n=1 Tax=Flavivirga eckloniae TaxID=1803846 RepID=A0A2K9PLY8_9FLAO|nr:hypothetical protein [Flavivirga eckloniae]AUP78072.1 hypothetical protein C1H87_04825 [Flavivirga eckloniae]
MLKFKLIWDFRGPNAWKIAEHHEIHLKEYIQLENLDISITGVEQISDNHVITFLIVNKDKMKLIRDALKPNRGQIYND